MCFYVYILKSDKGYYIGHTKKLEKRVEQHNLGYSKFTKTRGPWKLVYKEKFDTRAEAIKREMHLKRKKNKKVIEFLIIREVAQPG